MQNNEDLTTDNQTFGDIPLENSLRPQSFSDIKGRKSLVDNLRVMIDAAKLREEALDHVIFHGPPGLGKTSFASVISKEMGVPFYITTGPSIDRVGDLVAMLTNLEPNSIFFIDEIHRLSSTVEEILYPAMEDRVVDIVIGKGPSAKSVRLDLNPFTLVGATTKIGKLSSPLRDRFGAEFRFEYYQSDELVDIITSKSGSLNVKIPDDCAKEIARRSRGTPRIAIRLLKRIRDFADINNDGIISKDEVEAGLKLLNVDEKGLNSLDRKILKIIFENFGGGPVGLKTITAAIGEDMSTIESVSEPFLIKEGLLNRTSRGREITQKGIDHILSVE